MSPLFVIGNPRSGTSLFRLLLTSHSKMVIPPECGFIVWLYKSFGDWHSENIAVGLDEFLVKLSECKKFETWELNLSQLKIFLQQKKPDNYSELCAYIYLYYSSRFSKDTLIWGDKNNFHINYLNELLLIYPQAKFIHLIRDGRDVYCSYLNVMNKKSKSPYAPNLSTDVNIVANEWNNNLVKVDDFFSNFSEVNCKTVRYEDLIASPEVVLHDVFLWLGLDYETSVLNFFHQNISMKLEPEKTMEWKAKTREPIDANNSGNFKSILTKDEIERFNITAKKSLIRYGYF